jgi:hypothetical protein
MCGIQLNEIRQDTWHHVTYDREANTLHIDALTKYIPLMNAEYLHFGLVIRVHGYKSRGPGY